MEGLTAKLIGWQVATVAFTSILLSIVLLPWGAARELHVGLSLLLLGAVSFGVGVRLTSLSWTRVGICTAAAASCVFILGEIVNRGENYWIFGVIFYTPVAIFISFVAAGIGRAFQR
ncbi:MULTISPECIES: hypothetical protein [unclassified Pseudonocardia]|uniref:hypothetical protein n=1 Tax=unclassified Pseudonocardia TaxID=2619320 RepID=UPI0011152F3F|nr:MULTISPECIES: hypothetical protein [unclassified Pseudonocardia]